MYKHVLDQRRQYEQRTERHPHLHVAWYPHLNSSGTIQPKYVSLHLVLSRSEYLVRLIQLTAYKRKLGRPRKNWMDIVWRDLKDMDTAWDEAEELATNGVEWRQRVVYASSWMCVSK